MSDLFDYSVAQRLRDIGMAKVSSFPNDHWVQEARALAIHLARKNGEVTTDDVQMIMPRPDHVHQNAVGTICNTKKLKIVGYTKSARVSGHARRIAIYAINGE